MPDVATEHGVDALTNIVAALHEVDKSLTFIGYVLLFMAIVRMFKD